ncbi:hypothetical protein [Georgenia faecalis]|uniref:DUF4439 domain-containing protein n=1 Tax=Georgenia faecalis TaxID=2483799 RepID=A0ABV9DD78_9MICO|nr:hypothetical protein [Georgenia faecalis]
MHTPAHARPIRTATRRAAAVAAVFLLTGCGVRVDSPPPTVPSPGPAEVARQDAATSATELAAAATAAGAAADATTREVLTRVADAARVHAEALGGVWEPWPGSGPGATAPPEETASETASTTPPAAGAQPADVLAALAAGAWQAWDAATSPDASTDGRAALLGAVALSRTHAATELAAALGEGPPDLPAGAPLATVPPAARDAVDAARYAYEVVAARSSGAQREACLERARSLATLAGRPGGTVYDVTGPLASPSPGLSPEATLAAEAELDLVTAFLAELDAAAPAERAELLAAALDAADRARAWGLRLPALP